MNEPPASVEYEPPEQIDPAFAQLYDRIAELEAELAQHQWHRVEDGLPTEKRPIEVAFPPTLVAFSGAEWKLSHWLPPAHRDWPMSSFTSQGATHWRYSSPPTEDK